MRRLSSIPIIKSVHANIAGNYVYKVTGNAITKQGGYKRKAMLAATSVRLPVVITATTTSAKPSNHDVQDLQSAG